MQTIPEMMVMMGRRMFERRLLDMSGGNLSVRDGDTLYITPRYSGSKRNWQLEPADILSGPVATDELLQNPLFSREGKAHVAIYRNFPEVTAVVHAHPFHVLPFCAAGKPIPPVLEATEKFGVVECVPEARAHTQELADNVVAGLRGKEERVRVQAAAILLPRHGIIVAGKDLFAAVDAVERIDWNAWCILAQKALS